MLQTKECYPEHAREASSPEDQGQISRKYTRDDGHRQRLRYFAITLIGCSTVFLLLLNGYWVRSGDGEVYLGIARDLLTGKGYSFNGQPVALLPPLWPWILAGAMKISPAFWFLKLIPIACMIGFCANSYWILLRFTSPRRSAMIVLLTAMLAQVFPFAIYFHSDACFAVMVTGALLLAMQINEGRYAWWRALLMTLLIASSVGVRWNGTLWWLLIAAALLRGEKHFQLTRPMVLSFISGAATGGVFLVLRMQLRVNPETLDPRYDPFLSGAYSFVNRPENFAELMYRILWAGGWLAGLFWDLFYDSRVLRPFVLSLGWLALVACSITLWRDARRAVWIWIAAALQLAVLALDWPNAMPRYIMPMAPLILFGMWSGLEYLTAQLRNKRARMIASGAIALLLASVVVSNFAEYALEVWVQRSGQFYRHYEAGVNKTFIDAAYFLKTKGDPRVEISVTQRTVTNNHSLTTSGPMRVFSFLTGRSIMIAPKALSDEPDKDLNKWANLHNVRYYLWQPPVQRTYHFRGTPWKPLGYDEGDYDWRLYRLSDGKLKRITIPPAPEGWPREVPGLERQARENPDSIEAVGATQAE